jgi:hypothetical protein
LQAKEEVERFKLKLKQAQLTFKRHRSTSGSTSRERKDNIISFKEVLRPKLRPNLTKAWLISVYDRVY